MRVLCLVLSLCLSLYTSSSSLLNGGLDSSIQESREYTRALLLKKRVKTPPLPTKKDTLFFYNDDDLSERVEEKRLPPLTRKKEEEEEEEDDDEFLSLFSFLCFIGKKIFLVLV